MASPFSLKDKRCFNSFIEKHEIQTLSLTMDLIVVQDTNAQSVLGRFTDSPVVTENYLRKHLEYLHQKIFKTPSKVIKPYAFADVVTFYGGVQIKSITKKIFFSQCDEFYMVKRFFTKGVEYVPHGQMHCYRPEGKPLHIWEEDSYCNDFGISSFNSRYESFFKMRIVHPDEEYRVPSNTSYIVIAPTHTFFTKKTVPIGLALSPTPTISESIAHSSMMPCRNEVATNSKTPQAGGIKRHRGAYSKSLYFGPQAEKTKDSNVCNGNDEHQPDDQSVWSIETVPAPHRTHKRNSTSPYETPKKKLVADVRQSPSTSRGHEMIPPVNPHSLILSGKTDLKMIKDEDEHEEKYSPGNVFPDSPERGVFGIRKEDQIESYCLSETHFTIESNGMPSGSFTVENGDMDPCRIQYSVHETYIMEKAFFNNKSTLETPLPITTDLLELLQKSDKAKEKIVVSYFYDTVFEIIEATYKKFLAMKNTRMIGSCVPALVQMRGAKFSGSFPDTYKDI